MGFIHCRLLLISHPVVSSPLAKAGVVGFVADAWGARAGFVAAASTNTAGQSA
ncbi:hypothetical protein MycrhDRAFT_2901 [Mycolicibacterium rhodesiae JS60]|nr:hypothetical protein MycrhDRAFT_2901 [Mycolicibacterium rhodesiae JS60]